MTQAEWFLSICIVLLLALVANGPEWFSTWMTGGEL